MTGAATIPRVRKAYGITTRNHRDLIIVYAPNASKARAEVINNVRDAWGCSFREALEEVGSVTRAPWRDVHLPDRHPLASQLGYKVLHCVVHAYGGKGLKAGYRDHFYASASDPVMQAALYHGLFEVLRRDKGRDGRSDMVMYQLTAFGKNVARGEVVTYPGAGQ